MGVVDDGDGDEVVWDSTGCELVALVSAATVSGVLFGVALLGG